MPALRDNRVLIPDMNRPPVSADGCVRHEVSGRAFATTWQIVFYAEPEALVADVQTQAQAYLDRIDAQMSPYRADSDLTRFNQAPSGAYVPLPPMVLQVIRQAVSVAHLSEGAYDPGLLSAVEAWGFGAKAVEPGVPAAETLADLKTTQGWRTLHWQPQGLMKPVGLRLDLCGIAKGYAVDGLTQMMRTLTGVRSALIEVGGELKGFGVTAEGLPYWVELDLPTHEGKTVVALCDMAVATSGESQRFFVHDGETLSHTIDARTQAPTRSGVTSVTVFDTQCWRADALATALMVMGMETGMAFAKTHDMACLMRARDGQERLSPALQAWL